MLAFSGGGRRCGGARSKGARGRRGHQSGSGGHLHRVGAAGASAEAAAHAARHEGRRAGGWNRGGRRGGVLVAPPVIVRLTFREVPVEPHAKVTAYTAPRRASVSMVAVAVVLPLGMVVVSKMPEVTVVSPVQPPAPRVTRPPGAMTDGVIVGLNVLVAPSGAAWAADGASSVRALAPSRASGATRIARMVDPPGSPRGSCGTNFHIAGKMHLDARHARSGPSGTRSGSGEWVSGVPRPAHRPGREARGVPPSGRPPGTCRGTGPRWPRCPGRRVRRSPRSGRAGRRSAR